ncbi:hypothetical protein HELRODRAFT_111906 [Helobdella robusta]|uniref:UPAR/Ly6 domain-containing protein qvr n=1 Tax=Helobdella robusta TaxID=6412 RepID=T1EFF6_HELRO|nr:hypothetical protein HELRODRAFT_111906 [Helobdella robusta]ESO03974.1 hypothetical protein HELRODRAFT_111906 [Helobdella robusta]
MMDNFTYFLLCLFFGLLFLNREVCSLQCYQCDSNEDNSCPTYKPFDLNINALVDCQSFETRIPGTFCLKITRQSPGWYGWIKQTRRCGSRSETGVAWGCKWSYEEDGVWKEMCYCDDRDGCNHASPSQSSLSILLLFLTASCIQLFIYFLRFV